MNIKEITIEHLKDNNFEGLFSKSAGCCCAIDNLFQCPSEIQVEDCEPGYIKRCISCNASDCEYDESDNWCIKC